jgi:F0F1-type ATP synthase membrane subunit c/vacuolar-type H+-ATPase subunit K
MTQERQLQQITGSISEQEAKTTRNGKSYMRLHVVSPTGVDLWLTAWPNIHSIMLERPDAMWTINYEETMLSGGNISRTIRSAEASQAPPQAASQAAPQAASQAASGSGETCQHGIAVAGARCGSCIRLAVAFKAAVEVMITNPEANTTDTLRSLTAEYEGILMGLEEDPPEPEPEQDSFTQVVI